MSSEELYDFCWGTYKESHGVPKGLIESYKFYMENFNDPNS